MQKRQEDRAPNGFFLLFLMFLLCAVVIMCSCKHVEYVTVPEVHTEYYHTTDSVHKVDSVIDHQTTIVREVDSATLATYGIKLENVQRAWLIQNDRLMREIQQLRESKTDTLVVCDSIPLPYPVEVVKEVKYVPGVVKLLAWIGGIALGIIVVLLFWKYIKARFVN